jgi:hypothetical protein
LFKNQNIYYLLTSITSFMDFFKHEYAELSLHDGILYFKYCSIPDFHLGIAQKIVADRIRLQREQAFPVLCDLREAVQPSLEARKYLAVEGSLLTTAVAYLVRPQHSERLVQFFIQVDQPPVPSGVFTTEAAALAFLTPFKR